MSICSVEVKEKRRSLPQTQFQMVSGCISRLSTRYMLCLFRVPEYLQTAHKTCCCSQEVAVVCKETKSV